MTRTALLSILTLTVLGACEKQASKGGAASDVMAAVDRTGPVDTTPLPGVDVEALPPKSKDLFYRLAASLTSPCGKAHSLRTSVTDDASCKRAPFAARYVAALLADEAEEKDVRELYDAAYKPQTDKPLAAKLDGTLHAGPVDAPVKLVEFFDYGCGVCVQFKPELDKAMTLIPEGQAVLYYKMFPLTQSHPNSMSAAQAAFAAAAQGKFKEMHDKLFERSPAHTRDAVLGYAKELGLDLPTFEADYAAAEAKVKVDMAEGEASGVEGTPTLWVGSRKYAGPLRSDYIARWVAEEFAVNR